MAVKGIFTSDAGIAGDRKVDFAGSLLQTEQGGMAPFFALSAGMKNEPINSIVTIWFEEDFLTGRKLVTNNATTGVTFVIDDASDVVVGQFFLVETTGEYVYVSAVVGNTLTVERGFAETVNTTIDGSVTPVGIQRLGTAHEEASARPVSFANLGKPIYNLVHIFRNSWDASGTAQAVEFHTGDVVAKNRRDAMMWHAEDIERGLMWSRRSAGVKNGHAFRTMDGLFTRIVTNLTSQGMGGVKWIDIRQFAQDVFNINIKGMPNERIGFCGNSVLNVVDTLAWNFGVINLEAGQTQFGMNIKKLITPFGNIILVSHPIFNMSPLWSEDLVLFHPGATVLRWLRPTHEDNYDRDGTRAGADADFGVITSELTTEYKVEKTAGLFRGMNTADVTAESIGGTTP
jgi:hypothetical protein